ncbi:MAG: hypothetical protein KKG09_06430 [Verrucomicrobia bacterium]|nr:hypothetical protein [Verrucomicrobiota bacterium]MCG2679724.1 hypothetical protein [Kiritimatiellia bacterium]MBU4247568.1 hypothetical protein [Verrucomicrobiota bacterium]MBU4290712.1 hypothetical protein [Verrucomicrobiota bacterium]MBU4428796.1 hypothetical protein [Verrucomicrobiota bacterium]
MNEHLVKMAVAFAVGTGTTAGILRLLGFLPVPGYVKRVLAIVVPIPAMLIALVMLYYGPGALPGQDDVVPSSYDDLRKMFFYGIITALIYLVIAAIVRMILSKSSVDGDEDE